MNKLDDLIHLQYEQLQHDELAHRDILCLATKDRITHMTLHFAKYIGKLFQPLDNEQYSGVVVDTLIIALASANCLNINLPVRIKQSIGALTLEELAHVLNINDRNLRDETLRSLAVATGSLAKACEALDHQEKGDWRQQLEQGIVSIAGIAFASAYVLKLSFSDEIRARWRAVERKSIFYKGTDDGRGDIKNQLVRIKAGSR